MKKYLIILVTTTILFNCNRTQKVSIEYVTRKFEEYASKVRKVEYNIHRIDTSNPGGKVWNNEGFALIEKDESDYIFGFSFYGKRTDIPKEYIYDKGIAFEISKANKTYQTAKGSYGFIGKPGGQMILPNIFHLDSVYKSRTLIESENSYILKYKFEDDKIYNVTDDVKIVELSKDIFFPIKVTLTSKMLGNRTFSQMILSDIKINEEVSNSIKNYKNDFKDFDIINTGMRPTNRLLQKKLPLISLLNLLNQDEIVELPIDKLTLIDFWEVWCGHCISSFPKIESLKNKYSTKLEVIGIVSEDYESAIKLIEENGTTFINLIGNNELKAEFNITDLPRYFLIDRNGIVQKEYFGFSEQIENDIKEYISDPRY
jgi:thiol-disulfide isomerase/thioredoxin